LIDFSLIESREWADKAVAEENAEQVVEGECYLRTRSDKLRKHWAVVIGKDLYCFQDSLKIHSVLMHFLKGVFIVSLPEEVDLNSATASKKTLWPIKLIIPPSKTRMIYFRTE
jgi:hypothetical protein